MYQKSFIHEVHDQKCLKAYCLSSGGIKFPIFCFFVTITCKKENRKIFFFLISKSVSIFVLSEG